MSTAFETVSYQVAKGVATILLNRAESLNAFNSQLREELLQAIKLAEADASVKALVLGSSGTAFSSGADLMDGLGKCSSIEEQILTEYAPILNGIAELKKPVIAAVPGVMAGIGAALAMNCDLMVMADNAYMLMAFTNIALVPDGGVSWLLLQKLGYNRTFELIIEGGKLSAHDCVSAGIANKLVPADQVLETAQAWAEKLAVRAPIALGESKALLRQAASMSYGETVAQEASIQNMCVTTADAQEAVKAFMEKRQPVFVGK